ncbi:ABC transporter ATP-binding protein [candidate division KSB1 bacterium]|nr:MAG: ABC transporter ATP-binding protein [candidate division KSB1 bacterium]
MVEVKNLKIAFDEKKILDGVNLTIQDGEILSIIGISGTGKSVLLKNIIGLLKPDEGAILIDGLEITQMSEAELNKYVRTKMNMVFQYGALWDSMTIEENIRLGLKYNKNYSENKQKKIVKESLAMVGLEGIEKKYPAELSGGMNKRAGIARAIALQPKYLLYDEPTTGLDPVLSNTINDLIVKLNREMHITSVLISHDVESINKISHRVGMLYRGKIIHICDAKDMWNQDNEIFNKFIHGDKTLQ